MRPRVFPAEDRFGNRHVVSSRSGFNEAAGIPRGRPTSGPTTGTGTGRFNEAAGIPRGRPWRGVPPRPRAPALQ